jgi:predicted metal-binding membrane protein
MDDNDHRDRRLRPVEVVIVASAVLAWSLLIMVWIVNSLSDS